MTNNDKESFKLLFDKIYQGNNDAISLSFILLDIAHAWDDLIDKDTAVNDININSAFLGATVGLSTNPLWGEDLAYNLLNIYIKWQTANKIETDTNSSKNEMSKAWCLRACLYDLFTLISVKLYGIEWGVKVSPLVVLFYGETLSEYLKEFNHA